LVPKLVAEDIPLLSSLLTGVFPGSSIIQIREERLIEQLEKLASKYNLMCKAGNPFIEKVL
jgi:dynein heavy chain 1